VGGMGMRTVVRSWVGGAAGAPARVGEGSGAAGGTLGGVEAGAGGAAASAASDDSEEGFGAATASLIAAARSVLRAATSCQEIVLHER
jgi:hypothetical protein